jgi:hypothetical protein
MPSKILADPNRSRLPLGSLTRWRTDCIVNTGWNDNQVRFFSLHGGALRTVTARGYENLESFDWAPDSKSVFVATHGPSGSTLLRIGLNGEVQPAWRRVQSSKVWGIPSPDGRHIAVFDSSSDANAWMIESF